MIVHFLIYAALYLAFGFLVAVPLIVWITKEPIDDKNDIGPIALMGIGFPIFLTIGAFVILGTWYLKFLKRLGA